MRIVIILLTAFFLLPSCASTYAKKCAVWQHSQTSYALRAGAVDRIDISTCIEFLGAP